MNTIMEQMHPAPNTSRRQVVLVAGGSGGIGSEVARRLRAKGVEVALAARSEARLEEAARQINARAVRLDATDPAAVAQAFDTALPDGARLTGAVNCVGSILLKPAHLTSDEEWQTTLQTNLTSSFLLLREAARKASLAMHPLGRLGEPADVASAICWLLASEQSWITGQVVHVDGGLSTVQPR